jgi:TRAP-type mannitol/chloroaromatic compound transport system permease small subunit
MINVSARGSQTLTDSEVLADRMPSEKIEVYLQIAHATVNKSVFAILIGTLIVAFGLFFHQFLSWATEPSNAQGSSIFWIIQGFYLLIGAYLVMQGVSCLVEARVQSIVMSKALQLKQVFTRKG